MKGYVRKISFMAFLLIGVFVFAPTKAEAQVDKPDGSWNISKSAYSGYGNAEVTDLYSNYYFTGVSKMKFSVSNTGSKNITVNIYRKDKIVSYYRIKIMPGSTATWTMATNSSKLYLMKFNAPCHFKYTVSKA